MICVVIREDMRKICSFTIDSEQIKVFHIQVLIFVCSSQNYAIENFINHAVRKIFIQKKFFIQILKFSLLFDLEWSEFGK